MVAVQEQSSSGSKLKTLNGINMQITLFPDRLIVKHLGMLSNLKTSQLAEPRTVMLNAIASVESVDAPQLAHGIRQLVIRRHHDAEPLYVLYPDCMQATVTELVGQILAYQKR